MVAAPIMPREPYALPRINIRMPAPNAEAEPQAAAALTAMATSLPVLLRIPSKSLVATPINSQRCVTPGEPTPVMPSVTRKRHRTEDARKKECEELKLTLEELRAKLSTLQKKPKHTHGTIVPVQVQGNRARDLEAAVQAESSATALFLEHTSRELHQYIASVRCLMTQHLLGDVASPVHPYVHLTKCMESRRQKILELKPGQMALGRQFIEQRSQFLDITRPHLSNEWYVSSSGDACGLHFFVDQLHGFHCVQRAFSAAVGYASTHQASGKKSVSYMTYHDDDSVRGSGLSHNSQFKVVTPTTDGPAVEANTLLFAEYDPDDNVGTIVATYVDKDDLRPFDPLKRIRQDITAVLTVSTSPVGVVIRHWVHVRTASSPQLLDAAEFGLFARRFESHRGEDVVAYIRQQLVEEPTVR